MTRTFTQVQKDKLKRLKNLDELTPSLNVSRSGVRYSVTDMWDRVYFVEIQKTAGGYRVQSWIEGVTEPSKERYDVFNKAYSDTKKRLKAIPQTQKFLGAF